MGLPTANTTCAIYHVGNLPPSVADVTTSCFLRAEFAEGRRAGTADQGDTWTHVMYVDVSVDIQDGRSAGVAATNLSNTDRVYIPDSTGTLFYVIFVERIGQGTPLDQKRVYLQRDAVSWPSDDV